MLLDYEGVLGVIGLCIFWLGPSLSKYARTRYKGSICAPKGCNIGLGCWQREEFGRVGILGPNIGLVRLTLLNLVTVAARFSSSGAVAQLGERIVRNDEATGSIPVSSTISFF